MSTTRTVVLLVWPDFRFQIFPQLKFTAKAAQQKAGAEKTFRPKTDSGCLVLKG